MDKIVEQGLGGKLLAEVSRSFYLTLKALPAEVRETLSLAYLLARAADTLADTPNVTREHKMECLSAFREEINGVRDLERLVNRVQKDFVPFQEDEAEERLLHRLPDLVTAYRSMPEVDRNMTFGVLQPIVKGQMQDIERFPVDGQLRALEKSSDLEEYTWMVAGCVGEFWSRLCAAKMGSDFAGQMELELMVKRGINYGKGLQLVNILRDVGKDVGMGRCYLPFEEIQAAGLSMDEVQQEPGLLWDLKNRWLRYAESRLEDGLAYVKELTSKRLRYATALPLLLGFRTLALLKKATREQWLAGVKVPRAEVTRILFEAGIASATRGGIDKLAKKWR